MNRKTRKHLIRLYRLRRKFIRRLSVAFSGLRNAENLFMVLSAVIIGSLGAAGAIGFRKLTSLIQQVFFQTEFFSTATVADLPWWLCLLLPAIGGLLVGPITHFWAREVRGSGIPEVMESVAVRGGLIRQRVLPLKMLAGAITIGSGGSAGREGPIVQIGSALGSIYGQWLSTSPRRIRTFVACGAAAGIAATFNAPIAGALFAVEVIIGNFVVTQFSPIVISSVVATVISRHFLGDLPAFEVPSYQLVSAYEFLPYTLLGLLAGLMAVLFQKSLYYSNDRFDALPVPDYIKPAIGGLGVGAIAIVYPQVFGVGYDAINNALWGANISLYFALMVIAKILATSLTLGSGGSGGIFAPSLMIGAILGSLVGWMAAYFLPGETASYGAYAMVGMGAVVAGTTHAPISAILILFELTNDYHIIAPLMISCILSVLLSTYLKKESIYTEKLVRRGLNIFEGRDINILRSILVNEVLTRDIEKVPGNATYAELIRLMIQSPHQEYFVVDNNQKLKGVISAMELRQFLKDEDYLSGLVIAADIAHQPRACFYLGDNLDLVMHQFGRHNVDELPVLHSREDPTLIGSIQRIDVINAYNQQIFKWDLAGGMHSVVTAVSKEREIELAEGYRLVEIDPPDGFVGKSLKELNARARYGIEVILIRQESSDSRGLPNRPGRIPTPDYRIQHTDKLLVMAEAKNLKYLRS